MGGGRCLGNPRPYKWALRPNPYHNVKTRRGYGSFRAIQRYHIITNIGLLEGNEDRFLKIWKLSALALDSSRSTLLHSLLIYQVDCAKGNRANDHEKRKKEMIQFSWHFLPCYLLFLLLPSMWCGGSCGCGGQFYGIQGWGRVHRRDWVLVWAVHINSFGNFSFPPPTQAEVAHPLRWSTIREENLKDEDVTKQDQSYDDRRGLQTYAEDWDAIWCFREEGWNKQQEHRHGEKHGSDKANSFPTLHRNEKWGQRQSQKQRAWNSEVKHMKQRLPRHFQTVNSFAEVKWTTVAVTCLSDSFCYIHYTPVTTCNEATCK